MPLLRQIRSRRLWLGLAAFMLLAGLAAPQLWAWHLLRTARVELAQYHPSTARESLERCLRIWPDHATARLLASRAARESGDLEEADRQIQLCQRLTGTSDETAFEWALLQAAAGNVREVESYLQSQADQHPEQAYLVWEALAEGYLRTYRTRDAMTCLDHWLRSDPDNVRALELRGRTFVTGKGVKRGSDDFRRVLELDPDRDRDDTRDRLTRALVDLGAYNEAIPHLERLARSRPDNTDIPVRLARCLFMLNQRDLARQTLEGVLVKKPDHGMALRTLGQFAFSDSQPMEAEKWLRRAVVSLPNDYQTQWFLYEALRQQGKPEAAAQLKVAEAVRERSERMGELQSRKLAEQPLDPALHVEMATLLMRMGRTELAERWLQSALALDPDFRPAHAALAEHYAKMGQQDLAAEHRRRAAE